MAASLSTSAFLKNALAAKQKAFGFWLTAPGPFVRSLVGLGEFNWVLIDAEHGQITDSDYYELCNATAQFNASPIIRVPNAEEYMIKRALDAGAHGVMTPMCHSADDARKIVAWNKYPPKGTRGFGPMFSDAAFHTSEVYSASNADENLLVIVQIESQRGVDNVEEIAKVEGLDVLFVGPFDLALSMNVPFGGEAHSAAIARILKAAHDAGKTAAIFCTNGEQARQRLEQGFDMVSITTDVAAIMAGMKKELAAAKGVAVGEKKGGGYS